MVDEEERDLDFSKMSDEELDQYLAEMRVRHQAFFARAARPKSEKPKREVRYVKIPNGEKEEEEKESAGE